MPRLLDSSRSARSSQVDPGFQTGSEAHTFRSSAPANRRRSVSTPRSRGGACRHCPRAGGPSQACSSAYGCRPCNNRVDRIGSQRAGCCTGSRCNSTGVIATTVSTSGHSRSCELPEPTRRILIAACTVHHASPLSNTNSSFISPGRKTGKCSCRRLLGLERFDLDAETRQKEHEKAGQS